MLVYFHRLGVKCPFVAKVLLLMILFYENIVYESNGFLSCWEFYWMCVRTLMLMSFLYVQLCPHLDKSNSAVGVFLRFLKGAD